ncbi:RibD family protein [Geodermatophilus sabuli]|uniref:2,5-diamino-6-(Ribosylamino)-4(3H)-pyrimidinone 5'-phosphate reductase n=1 Tax=Geodermatophilus sabuli TaxID=1564158 RepID=A0A285EAV2_9ACTN|nr:RibD family protein [Geodermatophilus sabuli]MBB3085314.1 2,5-diamino-6-(ribosylamino)-4(3H)-pyrimidinone 5'-phosphate reductase [Geodermatophilus sabuli]SNX96258.1 2,5-diamino-6-(ribosylamino)-4(3H)-pyrimidinone 5'-phosphate reductase [Geodermatophilus sabuli]
MRPRVVVHVAVSLEGATTGFDPDVGSFYALARTWHEDVTLTGADTVLAQEPALGSAPQPGPAPDGPLLVVVDSRARVRAWAALRAAGHWSDVLAASSARTPHRSGPVSELRLGRERVDLPALLTELGTRPGVATVRVDSGGALTGALLAAGLVDEVSLLVHPVLAGPAAGARRWYGDGPPPAGELVLAECRRLDGDLVWLRHHIRR